MHHHLRWLDSGIVIRPRRDRRLKPFQLEAQLIVRFCKLISKRRVVSIELKFLFVCFVKQFKIRNVGGLDRQILIR